MTFIIDVLDSSGNKLGNGPITSAVSLSDTRKLDEAGTADFSFPAADPRAQYIADGAQFDIYDSTDHYLGRYSFKSNATSDKNGVAMLDVSAWDALRELAYRSTHFRRVYVATAVDTVIADLLTIVPGWTGNIDAGIGSATISYEGESVTTAIDMLRERFGQHYRLGDGVPGANILDVGAFGDSSGVRIINAQTMVQSEILNRSNIALAEDVSVLEDRDEIVNRIIPLGAGQGTIQLTIENATLGSYTTQVGVNQDLSTFYYIEDADSIATYGLREAILSFPKIRPITNSDANIVNAANALKLTAEVALLQRKDPKTTYSVTVRGLRSDIKPGQKVRLSYVGAVNNSYITIENDFFVLDITRNRSVDGDRSTSMTISSVAEKRVGDADVIFNALGDIQAIKLHVPVSLSYSSVGPYVRRIDSANDATFVVRIKGEVLALNRAIVQLRTSPLKSSVTAAASGGGTTQSSTSGGGTTQSSTSGGGQTTSAGGSVSQSTGASGNHRHVMFTWITTETGGASQRFQCVNSSSVLRDVWFNGPTESLHTAGVSDDHSHTITIGNHTHTVANHTHNVTIPNHTHNVTIPNHVHGLNYGIFADSSTPVDVRMLVDGIDRSVALGGPWAPSGQELDLELDITTYLVNAAGGLRQDHEVTITCDSGQGDVEVGVDMLLSIQSIEVA